MVVVTCVDYLSTELHFPKVSPLPSLFARCLPDVCQTFDWNSSRFKNPVLKDLQDNFNKVILTSALPLRLLPLPDISFLCTRRSFQHFFFFTILFFFPLICHSLFSTASKPPRPFPFRTALTFTFALHQWKKSGHDPASAAAVTHSALRDNRANTNSPRSVRRPPPPPMTERVGGAGGQRRAAAVNSGAFLIAMFEDTSDCGALFLSGMGGVRGQQGFAFYTRIP